MGNEPKRTPAPWFSFWRTDDAGNADCGVFSEPVHGHRLSICRAPKYQSKEQWLKDSALICAAPELLDALKDSIDSHFATWMAARAEVESGHESARLFEKEPDVIRARELVAKFES